VARGRRRTMSNLHNLIEGKDCEHDWEWHIDLNNQLYGICRKCRTINDDYRSPEINI
jgi:hypothetical protein